MHDGKPATKITANTAYTYKVEAEVSSGEPIDVTASVDVTATKGTVDMAHHTYTAPGATGADSLKASGYGLTATKAITVAAS